MWTRPFICAEKSEKQAAEPVGSLPGFKLKGLCGYQGQGHSWGKTQTSIPARMTIPASCRAACLRDTHTHVLPAST